MVFSFQADCSRLLHSDFFFNIVAEGNSETINQKRSAEAGHLLNTVGGDVEAGLAIAEMIASLSIPTVSLVLGGGHSIGVPMAVSADYSFAVPSATMVIHPVRSSGMFIGVAQTYRNMEKIQDRITGFIAAHSRASQERLEELMLDTSQLVKDVGTLLEGEEAVKEGLIDEIGGIREALAKLHEMIDAKNNKI